MRTTLSLVSLAVITVALQAQTSASPQASDTTMTPAAAQTNSQPSSATSTPQTSPRTVQVQAASVSAELTKSIDTKKAKVGDEVNAKTTSEAKLPDGTELPKGTKLVGNVIDVTAKSKEQKNSHLVLAVNRAVTKDGKEMPIRAAVTSMTAPTQSAMPMDSGPGSSMGGGSASAGSSAGGGGSASAAPAPSAPAMSDTGGQAQSAAGAMLKNAQDRVAVGNMPNVMLSAPTTPDSAGVLDAAGQNISLDSGTKLTLNVIPAQPGKTQGQ